MKRFIINVVLVAVGLGVSLAAGTCEAADTDMRLGTFKGNWCGSKAEFVITKQIANRKFQGTVEILSTKQVDTIEIQQYGDNSLQMVRYLSGEHDGKIQVTRTHPPEILSIAGKRTANFPTKSTRGLGARLAGFLRVPTQ